MTSEKARRLCCSRCLRPEGYCLCSFIPKLETGIRLTILQDPHEQRHALNTARLVALAIASATLNVGTNFPDYESVDGRFVLFPGPEAMPITAALAGELTELIVLDGTWRKARKLLYLNPKLAALPQVRLPAAGGSAYRLRKAPQAGALSTVEAVAQALNLLEQTSRFDALLAPFNRLIEQHIHAMGAEVFARNYPHHCLD